MKTATHKTALLMGAALCMILSAGSCCQNATSAKKDVVVTLNDYGPQPIVLDIEEYTLTNTNFRTAIWTGSYLQVTLMAIPVGGEVGLEVHNDLDQFLRIEEGDAKVMMGNAEDNLYYVKEASDGMAIIVPSGTWHNIINTGKEALKIYSIYAPVQHPHGTVHKTFEEAEEAEHH